MDNDAIFTPKEAGLLWKKSASWVYRNIKAGRILVSRVGATWRISAAEIRRQLKPVNGPAVDEWTRNELYQWERRLDAAYIKKLTQEYPRRGGPVQPQRPAQPPRDGPPPCQ